MEDEDIKCPVCKNTFHETDCIPFYLNCLHTFCQTCLRNVRKVKGVNEKVTFTFICPNCQEETLKQGPKNGETGKWSSLKTNHFVLKLLKSRTENEQLKADAEFRKKLSLDREEIRKKMHLELEKLRREKIQLELGAEYRSKLCTICKKMAEASCYDKCHFLVEFDEERQAFPCITPLLDVMDKTDRKWMSIRVKRTAVAESLKKAKDYLNLVTEQLDEYMKSNEERAKCLRDLEDECLPVLNTDTIRQHEEKYHLHLEESVEEFDALENIVQQTKSIDHWKTQVDRYQQDLRQAREQKEEFGERSQSLFQQLLALIAPIVPLSQDISDSSLKPTMFQDLAPVDDKSVGWSNAENPVNTVDSTSEGGISSYSLAVCLLRLSMDYTCSFFFRVFSGKLGSSK